MIKFLITFFIFFYFVVFFNTTFSSEIKIDEKKSIKELSTEVKNINKEKLEIYKKLEKLKITLEKEDFLKDNLNFSEKKHIKELIKEYDQEKIKLEKELIDKAKNLESTKNIKIKLIEAKKNLYSYLVPYIKEYKLKDYLIFVKKDLTTLKQDKDLKENEIKKNVIIKQKINKVRKKIEENKKETKKFLKQDLIKKIKRKIQEFKNNPKFIKLSKQKKLEVLNFILKKIDNRINNLKKIRFQTQIIEIKIEIYNFLKQEFLQIKKEIEL